MEEKIQKAINKYGNEWWIGLEKDNPKLMDKIDIKQGVNFFEISINATSSKSNIKFEKFSRFPFAQRDLSFIVDEGIASSMITDSLISKAGDKLKEIKLFYVYKG